MGGALWIVGSGMGRDDVGTRTLWGGGQCVKDKDTNDCGITVLAKMRVLSDSMVC